MARRRVLAAGLAVCGFLTAGCGEPVPTGHPVRGKVVYKDGRSVRRLEGGRVWLRSATDPDVTAVGAIDGDGSFEADGRAGGRTVLGVPAGDYQVSVAPPDGDVKSGRGLIHPKYQDAATSGLRVSVPAAGDVTLTVEPGR